jgi:U3 small nucleolar RNA-associated protein 25
MTPPSGKLEVGYRKRFEKEFGSEIEIEKIKKQKNRPDDFKRIFSGNSDEMFRIGIAFAPKAIRLYAPFYSSDILIASPLGLRKIIGSDESSKKEFDFLSSIEILIIEHAESILMQNWMHLNHIAKHLNLEV